ncbi:MarR family transcriptional regulator [Allosaccharopolyspora coralli]|uniref:MarR family transcriptional regulator n=1 Tax=Allosaccharopolyspora coralli TaxID=2665642 RepID=A0A5Q3Q9D1_9PSEU|nr:MarR family transcriptional regulator [Allosaccharopolyspora coralli]QGK68189.1 MarR family transcriptional regulator [Allosaccharopolyspora coralli]
MTEEAGEERNTRVLRYVERFAQVLEESGVPRMPARVFAYVLAEDSDRYTAGDLAAGLQVSPAAISGAVRYLVQVGLVTKEREPGMRSDLYRIDDRDVWSRIFLQRSDLLGHYEKAAAEGVETLGPDTPGGRRMRESQEFFAFLRAELEATMTRWREYRSQLDLDR